MCSCVSPLDLPERPKKPIDQNLKLFLRPRACSATRRPVDLELDIRRLLSGLENLHCLSILVSSRVLNSRKQQQQSTIFICIPEWQVCATRKQTTSRLDSISVVVLVDLGNRRRATTSSHKWRPLAEMTMIIEKANTHTQKTKSDAFELSGAAKV